MIFTIFEGKFMRVYSVSRCFIEMDKVCDNIPVVSTITNLIGLFQKYVLFPPLGPCCCACGWWSNRYVRHLQKKHFARYIILLIPIFGNLCVGIYDFIAHKKYCNKKFVLKEIQKNPSALKYASSKLKNDIEVVRSAIQKHPKAFEYASVRLKDDKGFVLEALHIEKRKYLEITDVPRLRHRISQFVSQRLKNDRDVILAAIENYAEALDNASEQLKNDKDVVLAADQAHKRQLLKFSNDSKAGLISWQKPTKKPMYPFFPGIKGSGFYFSWGIRK